MVNFDVWRSPKVKSEVAPFLKIILMMCRNHIPSFVLSSQNARFHKFIVQIRSTIMQLSMYIIGFPKLKSQTLMANIFSKFPCPQAATSLW